MLRVLARLTAELGESNAIRGDCRALIMITSLPFGRRNASSPQDAILPAATKEPIDSNPQPKDI